MIKILVNEDCITFVLSQIDEYEIGFEQLETAHDILKWVTHLSRKNWIDVDLLDQFIFIASGKIGLVLSI